MKSKTLITIMASLAISSMALMPNTMHNKKVVNRSLLVSTSSSKSENTMQNSFINIYNSNKTLASKISFSSKTKEILVSSIANDNTILGANNSQNFLQICLRKPNQVIPYKEVWLPGDATVKDLEQQLNGTSFNYGDLLSVSVTSAGGRVDVINGKSTKTNIQSPQNYIITQNGLGNYNTNVKVNPIKINTDSSSKTFNVTGIAAPQASVKVIVNNEQYNGEANINGEFSIPVVAKGVTSNTEINVSSYFGTPVAVKPTLVQEKKTYPFTVNPLVICNGNYTTTEAVVTGTAKPNRTIVIAVTNLSQWGFGEGTVDADGHFAVPVKFSPGFNCSDELNVSSCVGQTYYHTVNIDPQLTTENPTLTINPVSLDNSSKKVIVTGKAKPNQKVTISMNNQNFYATANVSGDYSVETLPENQLSIHSKIDISAQENLNGTQCTIQKSIFPTLATAINTEKETNGGMKYVLNANLNYLTKPFNSNIYYAKEHLNPMVYKAWYTAFSQILKYNNVGNTHKITSNGYGTITVDYAKEGITGLTYGDLETIQNYLIQLPRMFLLRGWNFEPIYKNGQIVGENFYVNQKYASGDTYDQTLLQAEQTVTRILSTITPNMNTYQVIAQIETQFENSLQYFNDQKYTTSEDIVGSLIDHKAVCGGYSMGLEYLLERAGVENIKLGGIPQTGAKYLHAWNNINVYNKWYLADSTWGASDPAAWYLDGSIASEGNHIDQNTYDGMPTLTTNSISYNQIMAGDKYFNLMGTANYKVNSNNTVTITYTDSTKTNKSVSVNMKDGNNWTSTAMHNNGNGVWTITLPYNKAINTAFYYTVNNTYGTTGNIKINNLQTELFPNGINAIAIQ